MQCLYVDRVSCQLKLFIISQVSTYLKVSISQLKLMDLAQIYTMSNLSLRRLISGVRVWVTKLNCTIFENSNLVKVRLITNLITLSPLSTIYACNLLIIFMPSKLFCDNCGQNYNPSTLHQTCCQTDLSPSFVAQAMKVTLAFTKKIWRHENAQCNVSINCA